MAKIRLDKKTKILMLKSYRFSVVFFCIFLFSCASVDKRLDIKREIQIPQESASTAQKEREQVSPIKTPDLIPVHEDISPLKTRILDLSARNTPLRDVLLIIADATGLNLAMNKDVNPDVPITLNLKNVTAEAALNKIFSSVDYFYSVKENMLFVKAADTKIFELGHPAVIQTYSTELGGDMLGATMSGSRGGGGSGGGGASGLRGGVSQKAESDKEAFNFWEVVGKSIEKILGDEAGSPIRQSYVVNRLMGTIAVTATKRNMDKVESYLNAIKKAINRQVLMEAKVIEVTLSDALQFGIDWNALITFNERTTASLGTSQFTNVVPTTGPTFTVGTTSREFTALLSAIQGLGETRILSNPRINIMNGQTAILSVGRNVSYISKIETTQQATAGTAPTVTFSVDTGSVLSGIMLGIVPFIDENGEISLSITPIVSDLVRLTERNLGTPDTRGNYPYLIQLPTIDLRQMSTTVKVRSGQTVVVGGLISKRESLDDSQIPFLGELPILGYLFKRRDKGVKSTELVVLLQPVITSR